MLLTFEDPPANIKVSEKFLMTNSRDTQTSRVYFGLEPINCNTKYFVNTECLCSRIPCEIRI